MQQPVNQTTDVQDIVCRNRYVILAVILIGTFMAVLDSAMVSIALNQNGYYGPVLLSGPSLLSNSVGVAMILSAVPCVLGMIFAFPGNIGMASGSPRKAFKKGRPGEATGYAPGAGDSATE